MAIQQFIINVDLVGIQDRQCTNKVILRRVRAAIVAVGKQCVTYSDCVFVAYNAHVLYCPCDGPVLICSNIIS